jgi:NitT/TauT family transport system permease protein
VTGARQARGVGRAVERLGPVLILAGLAGSWELLVRAGAIGSVFFPAPSAVAAAVWRIVVSGDVVTQAAVTMMRTLAGFGLGAGTGLLLGFAMGAWPRLHALLDPLIALAHPIPKIAVLPLILIVFGIDEASKIALGALVSFFPMLINTVAAVRNISPTYFEVARSYGASPTRVFTRVMVPGSLPLVMAGARLSLNVALMMVIAAELLIAQRGLGQRLWFSWQTMRIADVYAWLVVTGCLGVLLNALLAWAAVRAMPWRDDAGRVVG